MSLLGGLILVIEGFIQAVGYPGLFLMAAVEGVITVIPSEAITPFAGALAAQPDSGFVLPLVVLTAATGMLVGAMISYTIGHKLGRPAILRYGRLLHLNEWHVQRAEAWFARHGTFGIFLGNTLPIVRSFISLPAGIAKMPFRRFVVLTYAGSLLWNSLLATLGYLFVNDLGKLADAFEVVDLFAIGGVIALVVAILVWRRRRKRKQSIEP